MLLIVDRHNGVPAYRQLMEQVKFQVATGNLKPGDELPSTRALAEQLGINPMTISKAYSLLEHEGVVDRRPGMPLVVSGHGPDARSAGRMEQLRQSLAPSLTPLLQLEASPDEAASLLREMLTEQIESHRKQPS
ncbi:MAG TPA: GntR family transcriptional regulator [Gammaproteobacteria bacterium]|nr:GntR family transcriptional regulator [Gammaproteobacteria bacterium]